MLVLSSEGAVVSVYNVGQCSEHRRGNIIISSMLCSSLIGLCKGILYGRQYLHWTDRIIIKVSRQTSLSAACPLLFLFPPTLTHTGMQVHRQPSLQSHSNGGGKCEHAHSLPPTSAQTLQAHPHPLTSSYILTPVPTHTPNQHHPHQIPRFSSSKLFHAVKLRQRQIRTMHMSLKAVWQS